ncbi:MAG: helix-turn-helix transcriptional regulator [Sphaerochaetaceae bacterium]|jgi:transcriptional regulator with XRE-family HTH domain|nr:helix-turn-helix transcriptional regulator [Sphaerochaetaceae bacterium]
MIDLDNLVLTEPQIKERIATNFKKRRKEHKISQKKLAIKSGVSFGSIKRFEQTGEISLSNLIKIAQILDLEKDLLSLFNTPYFENIEDMLK